MLGDVLNLQKGTKTSVSAVGHQSTIKQLNKRIDLLKKSLKDLLSPNAVKDNFRELFY